MHCCSAILSFSISGFIQVLGPLVRLNLVLDPKLGAGPLIIWSPDLLFLPKLLTLLL